MNHNIFAERLNGMMQDAFSAGIMQPFNGQLEPNAWISDFYNKFGDQILIDLGTVPDRFAPLWRPAPAFGQYIEFSGMELLDAADYQLPVDGQAIGVSYVSKPKVWTDVVKTRVSKTYNTTWEETPEFVKAIQNPAYLASFLAKQLLNIRDSAINGKNLETYDVLGSLINAISTNASQSVTIDPIVDEQSSIKFLSALREYVDAHLDTTTEFNLQGATNTGNPNTTILMIRDTAFRKVQSFVNNLFDKSFPVPIMSMRRFINATASSAATGGAGSKLYPNLDARNKPVRNAAYKVTYHHNGVTEAVLPTAMLDTMSNVQALLIDTRAPVLLETPGRTIVGSVDPVTLVTDAVHHETHELGYLTFVNAIAFKDNTTPVIPLD